MNSNEKERLPLIALESKKLSSQKQRYSAPEREMLAAKYSLHYWRHVVEGSQYIIFHATTL